MDTNADTSWFYKLIPMQTRGQHWIPVFTGMTLLRGLRPLATAFLFFFSLVIQPHAWAMTVIRDAEVESVVERIAAPVLKAAGPKARNVKFFYIADPEVNAFTAGGDDIILHTGMLLTCETPGMLRGVIAHELAHVMHHHVAKKTAYMREVNSSTIAAVIAGAGAVLAGAPGAGMAAIMGGMHIHERQMLKHSRMHEQQADQTGLEYLHRAHLSADGMLQLFQKLDQSGRAQFKMANSYQLTHPLTNERMSHIRTAVEHERGLTSEDPALVKAYARMRAKLIGYLLPLTEVTKLQPRVCDAAKTTDDCYCETILLNRLHHRDLALSSVENLLKREPNNPYFEELKGQILFEQGRYDAAIQSYQKVVRALPRIPLVRIELAAVLLEKGDKPALSQALQTLQEAYRLYPDDGDTIYLLGMAYGKNGQLGESFYYLAEAQMQQGNQGEAKRYAKQAARYLKSNSPLYRKNQDILAIIER